MMGVEVHPGGRIVISGLSLKALIGTAFQLSFWQISGGAPWMGQDEYYIEAMPPESWRSRKVSLKHTLFGIEDERLREMLQSLLVERFQLKFHRETSTGAVYSLKRSGKTLNLRTTPLPAAAPDETPQEQSSFGSVGYAGGRWVIRATTMPQLAKFASDYVLHAPVSDQTGLGGLFDYTQHEADLDPDYRDNSASFLRLVSELGLKLERSQGPNGVLVIDSATKPSSN
jgi:uncharacterized protein (TIGR03435 family)